MNDISFFSARELAEGYTRKQFSPTEVIRALLERIERLNPAINAFCTVSRERALAGAAAAETSILKGESTGPLSGVPIAIKDATETAGIRTTYGSRIFSEYVPDKDALVVERLRKAGAIVIGKTNTPEFACKGTTDNRLFGPTRNPWDIEKTAGGSSGGSAAAVAAGLVPLAEGSDLAGSVRIPAACCGVVGFRPTLGRVPCYPTPNAWTTLLTHGPLCRTVADAALFLSVVQGADARDPQSYPCSEELLIDPRVGLGKLKVAWSPTLGYAPLDPELRQVTERAVHLLEQHGATVEEVDPGFEDPKELFVALTAPWRDGVCGQYLEKWESEMDATLVGRLKIAGKMSAREYETAQQRRTELSQKLGRFFERFDILITPTTSVPAFPVVEDYPREIDGKAIQSQLDWYPFTFPFSMTGQPSISVPAGWTDQGLPIGIQIIGKRFDDQMVLQAAASFEAISPWTDRHPPISMVEK
jgi:Asp-tRNA(Asn)/Glu-tRNA(Gln) amidotransferase A subunit family amidase